MKPPALSTARSLALGANWLQVVALTVYAVYSLAQHGSLLASLDDLLAIICLVAWLPLLAQYLRGEAVAPQTPALVALRNLYVLLGLFRVMQWVVLALAVADGWVAPSSNLVSLTALFVVWGAAIVSRTAVYAVSGSQFVTPTVRGKEQLLRWLNLLAALELALMVFNVWPPAGFGTPPTEMQQGLYGVLGILETVACLLAYMAVEARHTEDT